MTCETFGVVEHIEGYIVDWVNHVASVNGLVNDMANVASRFVFVLEIANLVNLSVDARRELEVQFAFELQQTRLHAEQVIALTLLEVRVAAFEQELAHFQIVVGVILIADAHGQNVYLLEAFHERAFPAQSKHFHQ